MSDSDKAQLLGPWMTAALVVGGIIGSGIFMLPVALAPLGPNAVAGWLISGAGALCIAFALSRLVTADGAGLQAYIERGFGPLAGFVVAWCFLVSTWAANAALAIAAASATSRVVPALADSGRVALLAVGFIVFLTAVNAAGARAMGRLAVLTTLLKILPLVAVIVLVAIGAGQGRDFEPLAPVSLTIDNIAVAVAMALYALTGFENALAPVGKVRDPARNIPRAMVAGTAFVAVLYLLSSSSVLLLLPQSQVASSAAPFADALVTQWGEGAAIFAALGIAIAAFGALNGGIMVAGEAGYSMALRGDLPAAMMRIRGANTPIVSQLISSAIVITLVLLNSSRTTASLFQFVILLSTVAVLVVYLIGALEALRLRPTPLAALPILVGIGFALFAFYGSGLEANLWGLALLAAGLVIRTVMRSFNSRAATPPAAAPAAPPGSSA
jgi:basic amino acid/polyamine antiporter, APA family